MNRRYFIQALAATTIAMRTRSLWAASTNRAVIVGAGIIGTSIGYHLAKRGAQVTILEKEKPGSGATGKSFAFLNASRKQPRSYYDLNLFGIEGWRRLQLELGQELKVQWGGAVEWKTPGETANKLLETVHAYQQWGYSARQIDASELHALLPEASPGAVGAAAFYEEEAAVDPLQVLDLLVRKTQGFGATIESPLEVTGLDIVGDRVRGVQTARGKIEADVFVFAAGAGTQQLAKFAEVNVPLDSSIGVLAHTAPQPALLGRVTLAPGFSIRQNPDGRIVTGGSVEGKEGAPGDQGVELLQGAAQYIPRLHGASVESVTVGHRVLPKDGYPILGFAQKYKNLYIAATHSGMTLAPIIGQLASIEILDGTTVDLLAPYRPARFADSDNAK
jgi:glycine/D-amino acid oxidase-like deaminating enzyme